MPPEFEGFDPLNFDPFHKAFKWGSNRQFVSERVSLVFPVATWCLPGVSAKIRRFGVSLSAVAKVSEGLSVWIPDSLRGSVSASPRYCSFMASLAMFRP